MATQLDPVIINEDGSAPPEGDQNNGVSLATPATDPDTGVSIGSPIAAPLTPSADVVKQRAAKIQEGIGRHLQKTTEEIEQEINEGREDVLRKTAAYKLDAENAQRKQQMLIDLANQKGGPLDENEVARIMDPFNPNNKPVDPDSVVEQQYGIKYISTIEDAIKALPSNPVEEAKQEIPEQVDNTYLKGSVLAAKMEYAQKMSEDIDAVIGQQSYIGRAADIFKTMWQPYNEYKMRGLSPDVGGISGGLLLGNNIQETADHVFGLPFDEYTKEVKRIRDGLMADNPLLAKEFVEAVKGRSQDDRILNNVFTMMAPLDYAALGKGSLNLARKISLYNRTNKAVRDYIKAADTINAQDAAARAKMPPGTSEPTINGQSVTVAAGRAEASGDVGTATDIKSTGIILQDMNGQGNPIKVATDDTLLTFLNQDREKISLDGGNLTPSQVAKIQDAYDTSGRTLLQRIVDAARINRTPMALATQNAVNIIRESIKQYYPGIRNAILDVSNPLYEPKSNTFWHEVTFGNFGGTLFSNEKTAANFAKLHGWDDVKIVEGQGTITPKEVQKLYDRKAIVEREISGIETTIQTHKANFGDKKLNLQERSQAKQAIEKLNPYLDKYQKEYEDINLKLRGKETFERVKQLEAEIDLAKSENKELRKSRMKRNPELDTKKNSFTTSKGSTYEVHEDGTTTRTKAPRPEHPGDEGLKPRSSQTVYITKEQYADIKANKPFTGSFQKEPKEGLMPVESWAEGDLKGKMHFGNEITEVRKDKSLRDIIEAKIEANEDAIATKAQELNAIKQNKADVIHPTTVEQHGVGFKIVLRRPLVETDKAVRDLLIRDASGKLIPEATSTASQTGFKSLMNAAIGKFRGADDTLAFNESVQRKIGTYTQSLFKEWSHQEAQYIKQISTGVIRVDPVTGEKINYFRAKAESLLDKFTPTRDSKGNLTTVRRKEYNEFVRTLEHARDARDPNSGQVGYFFQTPGELNNHYLKYYDRSPTFVEHQAYFAYVRMVEGDRILREISEFRNRARLGVEQFSLSMRGPDGKMMKSNFFDGRIRPYFPGGDDVMMIMGKNYGDEKTYNLGSAEIGPSKLKELREAVEQGKLKVIEVYSPEFRPLRDFSDVAGNKHIRYILTDSSTSKPIEFNHVNRRGGGHFEYDYDHFLKQADMYHQFDKTGGRYRSVYNGDKTFMPLLNRAMGHDIARKMNNIQKLIRENKLSEAKAYTQANLPIEWDQLYSMFKPGRDANGRVTPPQLDLDARNPFRVVPKGGSIYGIDKDLELAYGKGVFKDGSRSGSLNKQFQVAWNTERESSGLTHLEDIGTQGNPLYQYSPDASRMVDPITTMNRSLNRIVNSTFMDDYKMYAVEHWLREAEPYLKANESEIRSAPMWHFASAGNKDAFKPDAPKQVISNLLSNRYKINQFVGVPNEVDTALHVATQWLVDTAYEAFGPESSRNILQKTVTVVPLWMLSHIHDPVTFIRSLTFHAKLGLFAPAQLFVQMQTYATILSVSPFHGSAGTYATLLHQWSRINSSPEILKALDNYATKLSIFGQSKWKPGEFLEARELLSRTGFEKVAGEYANLNTALKTDFVGNDFKSFLNAGTFFFAEGEKATRLGAWYTAYREFREANPTGAISKSDLGKILQRADLLTVNMSRASSSMLHGGILSLTTQFLTYQLRAAELFMGTRLGETTYERTMARLRMATFYALLYGAPSAVGLTGLPLANSIREEAMKRGYVMGDNFLSTLVDQGLPAVMLAWITGKGDWRKGNNYNVGDRYGSPGFTQFSDALKSDHAWYTLLAGASGTTLIDILTAPIPFWRATASFLKNDNNDKVFKLKLDDFYDIAKITTAGNQAWKLIAAINTGKWMSKNEGYIGDVTKANAAFMAVFGLNPQQADDEYLLNDIKKQEIAYQKSNEKVFIEEYHRYLQAVRDGNIEGAKDYARRADVILNVTGYPIERKAALLSKALKGWEETIQDKDFSAMLKDVPTSRSDFLGVPLPFNTQTDIDTTRREQYRRQIQLNNYKGQ